MLIYRFLKVLVYNSLSPFPETKQLKMSVCLHPAEIMTGDLLEDLMSSEGEFCQWSKRSKVGMKMRHWHPPPPHLVSSVLAFTPPVPAAQRPRLHIQPRWDRRPVRPFRRPHSQPLTPGILIGAEGKFLQNKSSLFFKKKTNKQKKSRCLMKVQWRSTKPLRSDKTIKDTSAATRRAHWQQAGTQLWEESQARTKHFTFQETKQKTILFLDDVT